MYTDLILGTAGHIDHGKTALVKALTGVDTDRLPEEKERGITIEPGFAQLQVGKHRLGIVDVPGHERFIRQMLSGATGMDMVMLIISANESIKPQTVEHLEILRLLDLPAGVIVITKCDLVGEDWLFLVEEEIRQLVRDSFLAKAPIVRTSATTGMGIDSLKATLASTADQVVEHENRYRVHAPFRMAIDRSFSMPGHGAVITGSVASGSIEVGASAVVEPGGHAVRVRGLQNHDTAVASVHRGQRAAINITGIDQQQIVRGQEIAGPFHLSPSRTMTISLRLLSSAPRNLKDRQRVRFHLGTAELIANIRLLENDALTPGETGLAQAFFNEPAVATNQQSFVIRAESPAATIGGGRILNPNAERFSRVDPAELMLLRDHASSDESKRLAAAVYFTPLGTWRLDAAPRMAAVIDPRSALEHLKNEGVIVEIQTSPSHRILVHQKSIDEIADRVRAVLDRLHHKFPTRMSFPMTAIEPMFNDLAYPDLLKSAVRKLKEKQIVVFREFEIALSGKGPQLSKGELRLLEELVQSVRAGGVQPPDGTQLKSSAPKNKDSVANLLDLAVAAGDLHAMGNEMFLHRDTLNEIQDKLRANFGSNQGFTVSQLRELLSTTRKYAIPLAEYLDKIGFTRRNGDLRFLVK